MDRVLDLAATVGQTVESYVTSSFNASLLYSEHLPTGVFSVITVPDDWEEHPHVMLLAQVRGDHIFILEDTTDRPLYKALLDEHIPREQITLVYQGETVNTPESTL